MLKGMCLCVMMSVSINQISADEQSVGRVVDLNQNVRLVGRSGVPIGLPFRAKFAPTQTGLKLIAVNGSNLDTPLELGPSSGASPCYFVTTGESRLEAVHRGDEVWAYEYGALFAEKPMANYASRLALRFRSRVMLQRTVMAAGNDRVFPIPEKLPTDVYVDQLTDGVTIRGCLSEELGTWITIKGRWSETTNFKGGSHRWAFEVLEINGEKFKRARTDDPDESRTIVELTKRDIQPCKFFGGPDLQPRDGEIWELDAYETFHYDGFPHDVTKLWTIMTMFPRSGGRYVSLEWRRVVVLEKPQVDSTQTPRPLSTTDLQLVSPSATKADLPSSSSKPASIQPADLRKATSRSFEGAKAGDAKELNGMTFRWCPPGNFAMGEESLEVEVQLSSGFWLGETEVTRGQWWKFMGTTVKEGAEFPLVDVSHDEAVSYCHRLTIQERSAGRLPRDWKYDLPTEAQWEYGCRAGTKTSYSFGNSETQLEDYAWCRTNSPHGASQVGKKKPNDWGLRDMHGSVWEWCSDWWSSKLPGGKDPLGASSGSYRVLRGGAWCDEPDGCQSAIRISHPPGIQRIYLGFRLAVVPE